jgi:transcriptional regulator with XRE-family HTH domain
MERIQEAMKKSKMTQLELAKRSGIAAQYLNRVLLCKNWPSLKMLLKIEDALGIKIIWNENE